MKKIILNIAKTFFTFELLKEFICIFIDKAKDKKIDKQDVIDIVIFLLEKIKDAIPGTIDDVVINSIINYVKNPDNFNLKITQKKS